MKLRFIAASLLMGILIGAISSVEAGPNNTFIDNFGLAVGILHNKIVTSDAGNKNFLDTISISGNYDLNSVSWFLDGQKVRDDGTVRTSSYKIILSDLTKAKGSKDIIGYKIGRDKKTGRYVHKVTVRYEGGSRSWFVLQ